jgi:hypothetical protein
MKHSRFTEEELEAGDYKMDKMRDDNLTRSLVCMDCKTPFRYVLIDNIKIDNGDPDKIMHEYCPACDEEPKIERPTKAMMGHTWD